ncbi:GLPGLI family protein [Mucilaginibacter robiniae]|uniref:GLPGLI family protein n=1 Tax=Mucilaginibacter robiniae TaxID=2728022 RepID=A0A7L5E4K3_9SPHI|nr:GLPGLI family protein [Mucilaginibacter robiniae]QJD96644.1 GLPGLI family protein [Mucilaginibacter robiniae]
MKKIIILSIFLFLFKLEEAGAQTLAARYMVTQDIIGAGPLQDKKLTTIESTGYLYKNGGRYLYYEKPGYLEKYPDGNISLQVDATQNYNFSLCTDTLQYISYTNTDSLIRIYRPTVTGKHGPGINYRQHYEADYFTWVMLPETKVINGLKCQKATMSIRNLLQWIIWFTPKVFMQGGVKGIIGVPGLVVEAECSPLRTKYTLLEFSESVPLKASVFDLAELKEPYDQMPPLLKANIQPVGKSKIQKQADLTNQ